MKHCLVFASLISPSKMILFEKKYQTFDTVFHHQMKHLEVRQKYSAARRIFNSLLGVSSGDDVSSGDETLHLMFDILLQWWIRNFKNDYQKLLIFVFSFFRSNFLRLCILKVTQQSEKHLDKILNVDEFLKRIYSVIYSNDPVARAITVRYCK